MVRGMMMVAACALAAPLLVAQDGTPAPENTLSPDFARHAERLSPLVRTNAARSFLDALPELPGVGEGRVIYYDNEAGEAMTRGAYEALPEDDERRESFQRVPIDDARYYTFLFGTPALYARAIDLASAHGLVTLDGARVFDFGFGHIGHLRAMASC